MTILRLVGPGDLHAAVLERIGHRRDREVLRSSDEFEALARIEPGLELLARVEQLAAPTVEFFVQPAHECEGFVSECFLLRGLDVHQVLVSFL